MRNVLFTDNQYNITISEGTIKIDLFQTIRNTNYELYLAL